MAIYKPTFLYIKRHQITGLLYFGKTVRKDPIKYKGSGVYWTKHCEKHGWEIETIWHQLFESAEDIKEFAEFFSQFHGIVSSKNWANYIDENGLGGTTPGIKRSDETKRRIAEANKRRGPQSEESKRLKSERLKAHYAANPRTAEHSSKLSKALSGRVGKPRGHISDEARANIRAARMAYLERTAAQAE